ncbi:MAG TPA: hypothetical protein VMQ11_12840 [Alphaproteobacteria bacterium]|nr:hypothetical protein [Alphaproteobacteria bacterium]
MSEASRRVSILINMELDHKVSPDEAEEIANRLEAIPQDELWATLLEDAGVRANVISVDAEVVDLDEFDGGDDDDADEDDADPSPETD